MRWDVGRKKQIICRCRSGSGQTRLRFSSVSNPGVFQPCMYRFQRWPDAAGGRMIRGRKEITGGQAIISPVWAVGLERRGRKLAEHREQAMGEKVWCEGGAVA